MNITRETTPLAEDTGDVEEFICHLYPHVGDIAFCGLHSSADAHAMMHKGYGQKSPVWYHSEGGPEHACPACGTPVCRVCLRRS